MWKNNSGYLLIESALSVFILTGTLLVMVEGMVLLYSQEIQRKDELELAIFMAEMTQFTSDDMNVWLTDKAISQEIRVVSQTSSYISLEKGRTSLVVERR